MCTEWEGLAEQETRERRLRLSLRKGKKKWRRTAWKLIAKRCKLKVWKFKPVEDFLAQALSMMKTKKKRRTKSERWHSLFLEWRHHLQTKKDIESQLTNMMKSNRRVVRRKLLENRVESNAVESRIAAAKAAAERIAATKLNVRTPLEKDATSQTAQDIMKGQLSAPILLSPMMIAKQKACMINERLNYLPSKVAVNEETQEEVQYFEEELEINDFPQQVRYKVCSRDSLAQVQEFADVASLSGEHIIQVERAKG
uniref:Uncharacterized protein n=1 Tax=Ditylenchus dipsaci TaxID=166011 RepID=A0A915ED44_9BILA